MANNHSAEFCRGAVAALEHQSHFGAATLLNHYRALLAAAEASEAREIQALPLAELQRKHGELACELLSAAEVIAAAERALGTAECYLCIYENEQRHRDNWEGSEDQGILRTDKDENAATLALIARWKEANGGK